MEEVQSEPSSMRRKPSESLPCPLQKISPHVDYKLSHCDKTTIITFYTALLSYMYTTQNILLLLCCHFSTHTSIIFPNNNIQYIDTRVYCHLTVVPQGIDL